MALLQKKLSDTIRPIAEDITRRWLQFCAERTSILIKDAIRRDPRTLYGHLYYDLLEGQGVEYYDLQMAYNEPHQKGRIAADCRLEERLQKAILTHNTCVDACIGFWEYLHHALRDIPELKDIEAWSSMVRPRLVLFTDQDRPGRERAAKHNYIVIKFLNEISFVIDISGYQFGFEKCFYTLAEYESEVLHLERYTTFVDMRTEMERNRSWAAGAPFQAGEVEPKSMTQLRALELEQFVSEC
ncbi:hypothetical protein BKA63DRAFT_497322 [Paraphoma chrysanthemicola]|nr:hypothetical protein BKA63DRAFT_497322 [Paraphoma chrysanthemicola]